MSLTHAAIDGATHAIERYRRLLILPHANVDPDALSSALACALVFGALGKDVTVVCPDMPEALRFLPGSGTIKGTFPDRQEFRITIQLPQGVEVDTLRYVVDDDHRLAITVVPTSGMIQPHQVACAEGEQPYDLLVIVDTADLALLGALPTEHAHLFANIPILNIDHHISNTMFGHVHLVDPTCASTTEVLYHWFARVPQWRSAITPDVATLLLAGLITDTRSFQNPNTTPRSLEVAAALLELGGRQQEIVQHIYKTKPLSTLKLWGRALNRIQVDPDSRMVWSAISQEDLAEMGAASAETHGILDELLCTIPGADVYVLFTETVGEGLKGSIRTSAALDASVLAARAFGGGGHPRAAGFRVREGGNFSLQVLACVQKLRACLQELRRDEREDTVPLLPSSPQQGGEQPHSPVAPKAPPGGVPGNAQGVDVLEKMQGGDA